MNFTFFLSFFFFFSQNGASRSLRAALWRFAELAHLVRPQKCRYDNQVALPFYVPTYVKLAADDCVLYILMCPLEHFVFAVAKKA